MKIPRSVPKSVFGRYRRTIELENQLRIPTIFIGKNILIQIPTRYRPTFAIRDGSTPCFPLDELDDGDNGLFSPLEIKTTKTGPFQTRASPELCKSADDLGHDCVPVFSKRKTKKISSTA